MPNAGAFNVGDIVQLKSGGPKMTVTKASDPRVLDGQTETSWFAGSKREHGWFPLESLRAVTDDEQSKK